MLGKEGKSAGLSQTPWQEMLGLLLNSLGFIFWNISVSIICQHIILIQADAQYNFQCIFCGVIRGVIQLWTTVHFTSLSKYSVICKVTAHFIFSCCADWALIPRQSQHSLLSQTHQWWDAKLMIYIFIRVYTQHQTEEECELVGRVFAWRGILNPAAVTNKPIAVGHDLKRCITVTCWQITVRKSNDRLTAWQQEELVLLLNL